MTDDEMLASLLNLIDERFGRDIGPGCEWLTPRDALEAALSTEGGRWDLFASGYDEGPSLPRNPARPVYGPPIPNELRDPAWQAVLRDYRDAFRQQINDSGPLMAHLARHARR